MISVKTQFDPIFTSISTRQCSWFCYQAIDNKKQLIDYFNDNDIENFCKIYDLCLLRSSLNKKWSKDRHLIETLFHKNILEKHHKNMTFYKMSYCIGGEDNYSSMPYSNTLEVLQTKKSFPELSEYELKIKLDSMEKYDIIMFNRFIMSYTLIKNDINFLLIDSHINICFEMDIDEIINYINNNNTTEENIVTVVFENK